MNLFDIIMIIILIINIFWIMILFKTILKQANIIYDAIDYIEDNLEKSFTIPKLLSILKGDDTNE